MKLLSKLLCKLGMHGPDWFGYGPNASGNRNYRIGSLHRGCDVCGAEWVGSEGEGKSYRYFIWERIKTNCNNL